MGLIYNTRGRMKKHPDEAEDKKLIKKMLNKEEVKGKFPPKKKKKK